VPVAVAEAVAVAVAVAPTEALAVAVAPTEALAIYARVLYWSVHPVNLPFAGVGGLRCDDLASPFLAAYAIMREA
jgi:hypothetical protein